MSKVERYSTTLHVFFAVAIAKSRKLLANHQGMYDFLHVRVTIESQASAHSWVDAHVQYQGVNIAASIQMYAA